jgi:hypothetical protein
MGLLEPHWPHHGIADLDTGRGIRERKECGPLVVRWKQLVISRWRFRLIALEQQNRVIMKVNIIRRFALAAASLGMLLLLTAGRAEGVSVTYTFEQLSGKTTPLLNIAPDTSQSSFRASFTSAPTANAFVVASFQPNQLFSGNSLFEQLGNAGNTLTLAFNTPVNSVSLVFATNGPGALSLISPSGDTSITSSFQGGLFPGGTLSFSSTIPFTMFSLTDGPEGPEFAIDNLTMRFASVPDEGSTLAMASMAALLVLGYYRLRLRRLPA